MIEGAVAPFEETVIYHFKERVHISFRKDNHISLSFRKDNHISSLKDCPQGIIHPLSNGVDLLSFLTDSILTRGIMPC